MAKKRDNLTQKQIDRCQPKDKEYELRDHIVTQLFYRVRPNNARCWLVKYTDPNTGKRRQKHVLDVPTNRLEDARKAAEKFFHDLAEGRDPANARANLVRKSLTLDEAVELYEPFVARLRTGAEITTDIRSICRWNDIGSRPINNITKADLTAYINHLVELDRTARTINKKMTLLYAMMNKLYREEIISRSDVSLPTKPDKLPEVDSDKSRGYFEPEARKTLIETAKTMQPEWLYPAIVITLNTGLRPGTLFRLKWSDIDRRNRNIRLRAEIMKTKDEWIIPYNDNVAQVLEVLRKLEITSNADSYILIQPNGTPISTASGNEGWIGVFQQLCYKAGIENKTWYHMRHDFASQLVMAGVDLYTVKDLMCHKNITTTQIYAHLAPDLKRAAVARLDSI